MTDQSRIGENIETVQFSDKVNYDIRCNNILNINKNYIQKYENKLIEILKDLDKQINDKLIKLQDSKERKERKLVENILEKFNRRT